MERNHLAVRIVQWLTDGILTDEQKHAVRRWLAGNRDTIEKEEAMRRIWNRTEAGPDESVRHVLAETRRKIGLPTSEKRRFFPLMRFLAVFRYAAVVICIVATAMSVWYLARQRQAEPEMLTCYVPAGERRTLVLPDGSRIQVNAGTTLLYPRAFGNKNRTVYLAGEAFFSVAKDETKPFIVSAGPLKVRVLGTKFNVKAYSGDGCISTTLEQGKVEVYKEGSAGKPVVMEPAEQLVYHIRDDRFTAARVNPEDFSAWTQGELRFTSQPAEEILDGLGRRYGIRFRIAPGVRLEGRYTMRFKKHESLETALHVFAEITGNFVYRTDGQTVCLFPAGKEVAL